MRHALTRWVVPLAVGLLVWLSMIGWLWNRSPPVRRTAFPAAEIKHSSMNVWNSGFSPDGETFITSHYSEPRKKTVLVLWDVATGEVRGGQDPEALGYPLLGPDERSADDFFRNQKGAFDDQLAGMIRSPFAASSTDGRYTARFDPKTNRLSVQEGDTVRILHGSDCEECIFSPVITFSPDGRTLVVGATTFPPEPLHNWMMNQLGIRTSGQHSVQTVELWDTASGTKRATLTDCHFAGFYRDGALLLTQGGSTDERYGLLELWDVPPARPIGHILSWSAVPAVLVMLAVALGRFLWRRLTRRSSS